MDRLDIADSDTLCWWLCERQLPNGGLNGRPEKLEDVSLRNRLSFPNPLNRIKQCAPSTRADRARTFGFVLIKVCYSWWALASLAILNRAHWIDAAKLSAFILSAQDPEKGGIADRPDDVADVWHTVFGLAGAFFSPPRERRES